MLTNTTVVFECKNEKITVLKDKIALDQLDDDTVFQKSLMH